MYKRIRDLREDKDLTQKELAEYLSISRSAYSNYENGIREIPIEIFIAIANYYQTTLDYLTGRTDDKTPYNLKSNR